MGLYFNPNNASVFYPSPFCVSRNFVSLLKKFLEKVVWGEKVNMEEVFPFIHAMKKNA